MMMEILSNFSSAYCFISFILGALFMLTMLCIAAMGKVQEPINKVHFYVKAIEDNVPWLYIQRSTGELELITYTNNFTNYGLNPEDFANMKKGEMREVFITLND